MRHFLACLMMIILSVSVVNAQQDNKKVKNLPNYDMKTWHFGFSIGTNNLGFRVERADVFMEQNDIFGVDAERYLGFHIGPLSNLRLNKYMDLRMLIDLSFNQRDLVYHELKQYKNSEQPVMEKRIMQIRSTMLEFPVLIKYKAERINNFSPYLVAGANFRYDLSAGKNVEDEEAVCLKHIDPCITFGGGADFYLPYFKLSIELRYSLGLLDTMKPDGGKYTNCLKSLKSNAMTLSFHFE